MILPVLAISIFNPFDNNRCINGDCKNGHGIYVYNSGMMYEGEWKDGKRHGKGRLIYPDGTMYEGEWKDDRMDGFGIKTSPAFRAYKYIGEWKKGNKHGKGIQYFAPDEWYKGEWKNGVKDGYGEFVIIRKDGTIKSVKGLWRNDQLMKRED
jgi:hypothetical protein